MKITKRGDVNVQLNCNCVAVATAITHSPPPSKLMLGQRER